VDEHIPKALLAIRPQMGEYERLNFDPALRVSHCSEGLQLYSITLKKEVAPKYGTSTTAGERANFVSAAIQVRSKASPDSL